MNSIIIDPKTKKEFVFLSDLLKKMNIDITIINQEQKEDLSLAMAIKKG